MSFTWTPHRFAGGALALDVANSVILRFDPALSIDRFADPAVLDAFVPAAIRHCAEAPLLADLQPTRGEDRARLFTLREHIDEYFRQQVLGDGRREGLADLLEAAAAALRHAPSEMALEAQCALSALRLLTHPAPERLKICGQCGWLFLDRSKNRSRFWCDMAVCGNRVKASRHYRRQKQAEAP